jgi:hypothetical protein
LLLTGILVLIAQGSAIQIVVGALLTLTFLHFYARYEPFIDDFVLSIKIISYWQIFFVFWIALLIKADFPSMSFHSLGICLVFTIFSNVLIDLWKVANSILSSSRHHRKNSVVVDTSPFHHSPFPGASGSDPNDRSQTEMGRISSSSPLHPLSFPSRSSLYSNSRSHSQSSLQKGLDSSSI